MVVKGVNIARKAVMCFFAEVIDSIAGQGRARELFALRSEHGEHPPCEIELAGECMRLQARTIFLELTPALAEQRGGVLRKKGVHLPSRGEKRSERGSVGGDVGRAHQLTRRVHRQLRCPDVDGGHACARGGDRPDGRSARQIGAVDVAL